MPGTLLARLSMLMGECILDKTLMIIGGGVEQIPAYLAAKRRGLHVVGTDMSCDAPGLSYADHRLHVSTRDSAATTLAAIAFNRSHHIDGVMTIANDVPYTVACVANALGLPSISLDAAMCVSDKQLMKERFFEACGWSWCKGRIAD